MGKSRKLKHEKNVEKPAADTASTVHNSSTDTSLPNEDVQSVGSSPSTDKLKADKNAGPESVAANADTTDELKLENGNAAHNGEVSHSDEEQTRILRKRRPTRRIDDSDDSSVASTEGSHDSSLVCEMQPAVKLVRLPEDVLEVEEPPEEAPVVSVEIHSASGEELRLVYEEIPASTTQESETTVADGLVLPTITVSVEETLEEVEVPEQNELANGEQCVLERPDTPVSPRRSNRLTRHTPETSASIPAAELDGEQRPVTPTTEEPAAPQPSTSVSEPLPRPQRKFLHRPSGRRPLHPDKTWTPSPVPHMLQKELSSKTHDRPPKRRADWDEEDMSCSKKNALSTVDGGVGVAACQDSHSRWWCSIM